jgi:hypothetical protein
MEKFGSGISIPDPQHWFESDLSAYSKKPISERELSKSENAFIRLVSDESASDAISACRLDNFVKKMYGT